MADKKGSPAQEQSYTISSATPSHGDVVVGSLYVDPDDGKVFRCTSVGPIVYKEIDTGLNISKSITIENPTSSEDISAFFTNAAITISEIRAVLVGTSTPSVTWTVRHGTDRNATGAEVVTSGTTTTSVTSGDDVTSFNDATVIADSFVWIETTAKSGTVTELHITIIFTED